MTLVTRPMHELSTEQETLVKKTLDYKKSALSFNTRRTYRSMWNKFSRWCKENNSVSLPATSETIALYLADIGEGVSFSTLNSTIAAIENSHKENGAHVIGNCQLYLDVKRGIRRTHPEKLISTQSPALSVKNLKIISSKLGDSPLDIRDRALITVGFWGAFRRIELTGIQFDHVKFDTEGMVIQLLGSKTSDKLEEIFISNTVDPIICPVIALKRWLSVSGIESGYVFRSLLRGGGVTDNRLSGHSVSKIMKRLFGQDYSGHSLRRGLVTESARAGAQLHEIKKFSRHKSSDMVLRYTEAARGFDSTPAKVIGV